MIVGLLIGKDKSFGVPGKNYMQLLGRPLAEYPMLAAKNSQLVDHVVVSTDSPKIKELARGYEFDILDRPEHLCKKETPTEDVFSHAYNYIVEKYGVPEFIFLMFANSPDILSEYWDQAVSILRKNKDVDAVISVSKYNMFSPLRARKVNEDGTTEPLIPISTFGVKNTFDRDALGDCFFADFGVQVVRPECLANMEDGALPFKWLGKKQASIKKDFGFDLDAEWQVPVLEYWLIKHGFTAEKTPYQK